MTLFIVAAILAGRFDRALWIFAAAAATDFMDGYLARRFLWTSPTGTWIDPICDKILLGSIYLVLYAVGSLPGWFVTIIVGRDLLLLHGTVWALAFTGLRNFSAVRLGQASTLVQVVIAVAILAARVAPALGLWPIASALFWPAAALAIGSCIHYFWRAVSLLSARR